ETTTQGETSKNVDVTETTTKKASSGGSGGGGGGSSSRSATRTTVAQDVEDETETTTKARATGNEGECSFTVTGKDGQEVVITPPTDRKDVSDFVDVPKSHWAYDSIMKLAELGIINGVGDDRFAPADPCKRCDFIIMINNTLGIKGTAKFNFSDVAANKYYYDPVGVAYEIGIASGYGDDTFKPENYCTREEMMVLVAKTFEFLGETVTTADQSCLDRFADAEDISWWAKPYTAYLVEEGMVAGTGAKFEPKVYMNRASLAVLMAQVYDKVVAMAAERGTSVSDVVDEIVDEASAEEVTAADVIAKAAELQEVKETIEKEYLDKIADDVKDNFESRSAEFDQLVKSLSEDMSDEDAQKADVELKEYDELFSDIIDAVSAK
ncbi:MAG: S-layer homology domain-containing protein, partial [Firmicutes bacterium]|nr:S-layer homology domain-containing protein [Bacillota bacterium]